MANSISYKAIGGLTSNQYQPMCIEVSVDTYATGGVAIPFKGFEPSMVIGAEAVDGKAVTPVFDLANKKLKLFNGTTELSSGSVTAGKYHLTFFGQIL